VHNQATHHEEDIQLHTSTSALDRSQ